MKNIFKIFAIVTLAGCATAQAADEPLPPNPIVPEAAQQADAPRVTIRKDLLSALGRLAVNMQVESERTCAQANDPSKLWFCNIDKLLAEVEKDAKPVPQSNEEKPKK